MSHKVFLRNPVKSETSWLYPEALRPTLSRWNVLKLFVDATMSQIHRVRDTGHRLETDKIPVGSAGRIDNNRFVLRSERDFHTFGLTLHPHRRFTRGVPNQVSEYVVEIQPF